MHFTVPLALLSAVFSPLAGAKPLNRRADPWQVTNFEIGCSPGGCTYHFNVNGRQHGNYPAFNTTCTGVGSDTDGDYQRCGDPNVFANLMPIGSPTWTVQAKHVVWVSDEKHYGELASANVTASQKSFPLVVELGYGIA